MNTTKPHVIIPAAGLGSRMLPTSARIPKAMIPLQGKPVISWILDELLEQGFKEFTVIYGHLGNYLTNFVERYYAHRDSVRIEFVEQVNLDGVASAIALAEPHVQTEDVLVVLGDTVFDDQLELSGDRSLVMYGRVRESWRWCLIETSDDERIMRYFDKPDGPVATDKALVGIYYMHDAKCFFEALRYIQEHGIRQKNEYQISSALERYELAHPIFGFEVRRWYDCGSKDTFQETRKSMLVAPRGFNTIELDGNTVTKRSARSEEFLDEISWFVSVPKKLRSYIPTVVDYNLDPDDLFITLEYCAFPTLAELFLYENVHVDIWRRIVENITDAYFAHFKPVVHVDASDWQSDFRRHYLEKTFSRIEDAKNQHSDFLELFSYDTLVINGQKMGSFGRLFKAVAAAMFPIISNEEDLCLIHGDLCFSNVLYDVDGGAFKVIDPRGSFGTMKLYGDYRYDMAKLHHSAVGLYDFITHDLFSLSHSQNQFELTIYANEDHQLIGEMFREALSKRHGVNLEEIEFIQACLFYSMLPLHGDYPRRMKAFFCIATQTLNKVARSVLGAAAVNDLLQERAPGALRPATAPWVSA